MEDMGDLFDHIEDLLDFPCDEDMMGLVDPCGQGGSLLLPPLPASVAGVGDDFLDGFAGQNKKPGAAFSAEGDKPETVSTFGHVWFTRFNLKQYHFQVSIFN